MCDIGKPLQIIDVEPLSRPAPLRNEEELYVERRVPLEVPVAEEIPVPENTAVSPVAGTQDSASPMF